MKEDKIGGACSTNWKREIGRRISVGKPEGKRPLGKPKRSWVDNIKADLTEIEWDGVDWFNLAQDRDRWRALSFSRKTQFHRVS
jgi:hypothetical protein